EISVIIDPRYVDAANILALMALFQVINNISMPIALMAQSVERVEVQLYSKIGAIYNIISALILIPRYGPIGAAWATGTSVLVKNVLMILFLRKHLPLTFPWSALGKLGVAGLLMLGVLYYGKPGEVQVLYLGFVALLSLLVFVAVVRLLRPFDQNERSSLERMVNKKLWFI
ncbi:MAG: polysaccharide biosynthesis C-terminal domain-containing protein, partial [bacterium]